jgi:hypothetical protein
MIKIKKGILFVLTYFGFYPKQLVANLKGLIPFLFELKGFKKNFGKKYQDWTFSYYPIFLDKTDQSGKARGQYFYQDLHVSNLIYKANPKRHVDVGSRIDGFIAHLATFRAVDVIDIRPFECKIPSSRFNETTW